MLNIHIGPHKTGSTSFQVILEKVRPRALANGLCIPQAAVPWPNVGGHHNLAWKLMNDPRFEQSAGEWPEVSEEIRTVARRDNAGSALISSEDLFGLEPRLVAANAFDATPRGWGLRILYVARDQITLMNSIYTQRVKMFRTVRDICGFMEHDIKPKMYDHALRTRHWRDTFERVDILGYGPEICTRLLNACGYDSLDHFPEVRENAAPGPETICMLLKLGREIHAREWNIELEQEFLQGPLANAVIAYGDRRGWNEARYWGVDADLEERIDQRYRQSNDAVGLQFAAARAHRELNVTWSLDAESDELIADALGVVAEFVESEKTASDKAKLYRSAEEVFLPDRSD